MLSLITVVITQAGKQSVPMLKWNASILKMFFYIKVG